MVYLAENVLCVTMLSGTSSFVGLTGLDCTLSGKGLGCSSLNVLKRQAWNVDDQRTSSSLALLANPPHLTWLSQPPSGRKASQQGGATAAAYAQVKVEHLQTGQVCSAQGVHFQPMVVESTGAWAPAATRVLWLLARAEGEDPVHLHGELSQDLSTTIRRFRARATLRRRAEVAALEPTAAAASAASLLVTTMHAAEFCYKSKPWGVASSIQCSRYASVKFSAMLGCWAVFLAAQSLSVSAHDVDVEPGALLDDLAALKQELHALRLELKPALLGRQLQNEALSSSYFFAEVEDLTRKSKAPWTRSGSFAAVS
eukprot:s718_g16.t1